MGEQRFKAIAAYWIKLLLKIQLDPKYDYDDYSKAHDLINFLENLVEGRNHEYQIPKVTAGAAKTMETLIEFAKVCIALDYLVWEGGITLAEASATMAPHTRELEVKQIIRKRKRLLELVTKHRKTNSFAGIHAGWQIATLIYYHGHQKVYCSIENPTCKLLFEVDYENSDPDLTKYPTPLEAVDYQFPFNELQQFFTNTDHN